MHTPADQQRKHSKQLGRKLNQRCHSFKEEKGCFLPQATTPKLDPSKWQVRHHERAIGPSHVRLIALSRQPTGECEVWPRLHGTPSGWCYEGNARNKDEVEDDVRISALLHLRPRHERNETRAMPRIGRCAAECSALAGPCPRSTGNHWNELFGPAQFQRALGILTPDSPALAKAKAAKDKG